MCHNVESWLNIYWVLGWGGGVGGEVGVRRPTWQSLTLWSLNKGMWGGKTALSSSTANVVSRPVTFTHDPFTI